jgi:hypothetical protein
MKTISIPVPEELVKLYLENETRVVDVLKSALASELDSLALDRMEYVRVICRAKAPVCNWHDMELQILKGSL